MELTSNNPRRTYTLISKELPVLDVEPSSYGLETVLNGKAYYSRLRLANSSRPNLVLNLSSWRVEPKPWKEVALDLYYQNEGSFLEGKNYWTSGELEVTDSILKLKKKLEKKTTEADFIDKLEKLTCKENSPWDWSNSSHRATLLKETPKHLKNRRTNIIKQVTSTWQGFLSLHLKEADERFCIVINGNGGTGKTRLAEELIIPKLAESGEMSRPRNYSDV